MSVYMTISLSLERYISVVHPLWAINHRAARSCLWLAGPGVAFSLLFTLPNYFILSTGPVTEEMNLTDLEMLDKVYIIHNLDSLTCFTIQMLENYAVLGDPDSGKTEAEEPRLRLVWATWRYN